MSWALVKAWMEELLEAWSAKLFKGNMHSPQLCLLNMFFGNGLNDGCVKIIDLSISGHNLTSMACHY
jgi:hypothetical protein